MTLLIAVLLSFPAMADRHPAQEINEDKPNQEEALKKRIHTLVKRLETWELPGPRHARDEILRLRHRAYKLLYDAHQNTRNERVRRTLMYLLGLRKVEVAKVILKGKILRVNHVWYSFFGGVEVTVEFDSVTVLKGPVHVRKWVADMKSFSFAFGTVEDWRLWEVLQRDLRKTSQEVIWVLVKERTINYKWGTKRKAGRLSYFEYSILPKEAEEAVLQRLRPKKK